MPTIYGPLDIVKNELRNAVVQNLGTAPAAPVKGLLYFNSADNTLYWYDGTQWVAAKAAAGAIPSDTVSTAAIGDPPTAGASTNFSRGDHKHGMPAFGAVTPETSFGQASSNGSSTTLARADHTHGTPAHNAAAHATIPISALGAAGADINLNGYKITNVGVPAAGTDATNKNYVDSLVAGLSWKQPVRAATTGSIALTGGQTIDGVVLADGDRVLVKNQASASQNGIYVVSTSVQWDRPTDADSDTELLNASVYVAEGTVNADTAWVQTTNLPISVGTTNLTWVQFAGAGTITAGDGLTRTGNVLNVGAGSGIVVAADTVAVDTATIATRSYVDTAVAPMVTTAGAGLSKTGQTIDVGAGSGISVAADTIAVDQTVIASRTYVDTAVGGTLTTAGAGLTKTGQTVDVGAGTGITVAADTVAVDTAFIATRGYVDTAVAGAPKKYVAALTGTASPETVTHNLNTRDVLVQVLNGSTPYSAVEVDWDATTLNTITVRYNPNLGAGYRVVVIG